MQALKYTRADAGTAEALEGVPLRMAVVIGLPSLSDHAEPANGYHLKTGQRE